MQPTNPSSPPRPPQRPQFFDVMRPGRTPASPNSRPVLASNRPPVPDNSMKTGAPALPASVKPATPPAPLPAPKPQSAPPNWTQQPAAQAAPVLTIPAEVSREVGQAAMDGQLSSPEQAAQSGSVTHPQVKAGKHSIWSEVLAILAIAFLIAIIINILLDADIIDLPIPHTNLFEY